MNSPEKWQGFLRTDGASEKMNFKPHHIRLKALWKGQRRQLIRKSVEESLMAIKEKAEA